MKASALRLKELVELVTTVDKVRSLIQDLVGHGLDKNVASLLENLDRGSVFIIILGHGSGLLGASGNRRRSRLGGDPSRMRHGTECSSSPRRPACRQPRCQAAVQPAAASHPAVAPEITEMSSSRDQFQCQ